MKLLINLVAVLFLWIGSVFALDLSNDSTVDVSSSIQSALDGGGVVTLPAGVHYIGTGLRITISGTQLIGTGGQSNCVLKVKGASGINAITISNGVTNFILKGFSINGQKSIQLAGVGININGGSISNGQISGVSLLNIFDSGIVIANGAHDIDISGIYEDSIGTPGQTNLSRAFCIYIVTSCYNIRIGGGWYQHFSGTAAIRINNNCWNIDINGAVIQHSDKAGVMDRRAIFADDGITGRTRQVHISNVKIFDMDENGIFLNNVDSSFVLSSTVNNCGHNGFEINGNYNKVANDSIINCVIGISMTNAKHAIMVDNIIQYQSDRGAYIFASSGDTTSDILMAGNEISNCVTAAIEIHGQGSGLGKCREIVLIDNNCFDNQTKPTQLYGIKIVNDVDDYTLIGNIFSGNKSGNVNDGGSGINKLILNGDTLLRRAN